MTTLTGLLDDDLARLVALAEEMVEARSPERRRELLAAFIAEYMPQVHAKNVVVYAALLKVSKCDWAHGCAHRGQIQQQLIQELLKHLQLNRSIRSALWAAQASVLRELVNAHADAERSTVLPRLEECFEQPQMTELRARYSALREDAGVSLWGWPRTRRRRFERQSDEPKLRKAMP